MGRKTDGRVWKSMNSLCKGQNLAHHKPQKVFINDVRVCVYLPRPSSSDFPPLGRKSFLADSLSLSGPPLSRLLIGPDYQWNSGITNTNNISLYKSFFGVLRRHPLWGERAEAADFLCRLENFPILMLTQSTVTVKCIFCSILACMILIYSVVHLWMWRFV